MSTPDQLLTAALAVTDKDDLREHLGTIALLRNKNLSWREIAEFMQQHGVQVDHARLYRVFAKHLAAAALVPTATQYAVGLRAITISPRQLSMLRYHYEAHNRTVTYTELAKAVGKDDHQVANKAYGDLGAALGRAIGFEFPMAPQRGKPFYSGALGIDAPRSASNEYRLMMHHELAKAISTLHLFNH